MSKEVRVRKRSGLECILIVLLMPLSRSVSRPKFMFHFCVIHVYSIDKLVCKNRCFSRSKSQVRPPSNIWHVSSYLVGYFYSFTYVWFISWGADQCQHSVSVDLTFSVRNDENITSVFETYLLLDQPISVQILECRYQGKKSTPWLVSNCFLNLHVNMYIISWCTCNKVPN